MADPCMKFEVSSVPVKFRRDLWHQKATVPELSCDFVCVILCLAVRDVHETFLAETEMRPET